MRKKPVRSGLFLLFMATTALAKPAEQAPPAEPAKPAQAPPAATNDQPITTLPYTPGLDVGAMDRGADPCQDFYQYSCGGWLKKNPIPADQPRWTVYSKLAQDNARFLWGILDTLAKQTAGRSKPQAQIGDFFAACMDEPTVEKLGAKPLAAVLQRIAALPGKGELPALLSAMHLGVGDGILFGFGSNQDFADSTRIIAFADASGLGLPDRDYYTKGDDKSVKLRKEYVAHVARTLALLGDKPEAAQRAAARILELETALAKASLTRVEQRDPYKLFHKLDLKGLQALTPAFDWGLYLKGLGLPAEQPFNVTQPAFYQALNKLIEKTELADLKDYLRWHAAREASPFLSSAFVSEDFAFYQKTLRGVPQLKPRWKRCVQAVDRLLGEALGQEFVRRTFGPELKERTLKMTQQIERAMEDDLKQLTWMGDKTKARALEKLHAIVNKIGYPDKWRDYGAITLSRGDFFGNVERANGFEVRRQLNKIGKPLDRSEWRMTPPTVNAYFDPQMGDINFPAGVLQPPLFDAKMDDAPNYGNTGGTIGHELTHGFDDEGRQFDAKGNLKDWWTKEDAAHFNQRAQCIVDQYAKYTIVDDIKINSKLTLGEDVADLGGLLLAWNAWQKQIENQRLRPIEGLTPAQRFFVGYAQWACENNRPEDLRVSALTNPHSPGRYRVNGLMVNLPEFQEAFSCKAGAPMVREKRCRVW